MVDSVQDGRVKLMQAHPRLFGIPTGRPDAARGYPNCEEGWRDLLERCCARIEAALAEGGALRVLQIKEKFGALRFYWSGDMPNAARAKVEETFALAVARLSLHLRNLRSERPPLQPRRLARDRVPRTCQGRTQAYQAGNREHPHRPDLRPPPFSAAARPPITPRARVPPLRQSEIARNRRA